mmetsp:Transcript_38457/g.46399  ORF Transcript_38457/g.46399 Transcript_38457/m.46399 type:complete len:587 (+) Transcript_38457:385-2145(+)|eukprot:CAMPEP_0197854982 /NCGR_PEP_ID=MMETSP1438-20131217/25719_1 /TAXON_ID=1461541 /ORGANISM="Pterosperma sp., Strain CCMP1384" /LENGTH=586 /DNA_ID=CAMNT_0043469931 /DNA_START=364 /DNA_END=2124 /DNA_ORIENTATION=+
MLAQASYTCHVSGKQSSSLNSRRTRTTLKYNKVSANRRSRIASSRPARQAVLVQGDRDFKSNAASSSDVLSNAPLDNTDDEEVAANCPYTATKNLVSNVNGQPPTTTGPGAVYPGPGKNGFRNLIDVMYIGLFGIEKSTLHFAESYGPIARFPNPVNLGAAAGWTFLNDPELIEHCCASNSANYAERFLPEIYAFVTDDKGILGSSGSYNRQHRKMCMPFFQKKSALQKFAGVVVERASTIADIWDAEGESAEVELAVQMQRLTLDTIGQVSFSYDFKQLEGMEINGATASEGEIATDRILVDINTAQDVMGKVFVTPRPILELMAKLREPNIVRMQAAFKDMRETVTPVIQARRQKIARGESGEDDLLEALLTAEGSLGWTDDEIWEDVHDVMGAGHETTASTLTAALYSISQHPEVDARMQAEIAEVLGDRAPTYDDMDKLVYCQQVVKEVLRLYPPIPVFPRVAAKEDTLPTGHKVIPNEVIFMSSYAMGRSDHVWEKPQTFDPSRFDPENEVHRFQWVPFGAGPRMCMGAGFAMLSTTLALVRLVQRYQFESLKPQGPVFPIAYDITMNFPGGVDMKLTKRQ